MHGKQKLKNKTKNLVLKHDSKNQRELKNGERDFGGPYHSILGDLLSINIINK
jgi:hypothetical protein